jgi:tetratricopeptide (TPR) repeat protein
MIRLFPALLSLLLLCYSWPAAADQAAFARGRELFAAGDFAGARIHLEQAFRDDPANPDINFYLGRTAFELGDYETALMAYERVLIADPNAARVKLEIARCHLRLGFREMARHYFREVLATNPPAPVWQNIERYLAEIEAQERRHLFTGTFTLGLNWDDNVYQSPVSDTILGLQLTGSTARPTSDRILDTTAVINHVYQFEEPRLSWKTTLTDYNALYEDRHDLDVAYYSLGSGPVWNTGRYLWHNQAIAKHIDVEHDRYLDALGFASALTLPAAPGLLVTVGGRLEEKNNYDDPLRDATNAMLHVTPVLSLGPNRLSALLAKERENAGAEVFSYDRISWSLQYERELTPTTSVFGGFNCQSSDYLDADPFFLVNRADTVQEWRAGASRLLWQSAASRTTLAGQLVYSYLESDSNIDIYTYRKHVVSLSCTLGF